ncbi:hypothetical protein OG292_02445 [Streptomyces sp. NBC_01511]|uniref:hypothetical protein n=1 Tax=unclassified Streptomyces TaxID=2593676 RepID=UPI00386A39E4
MLRDGAPRTASVEIDGELTHILRQLIRNARAAGDIDPAVTVRDLLLVVSSSPPSLSDPLTRAQASSRLIELLLAGLRRDRGAASTS